MQAAAQPAHNAGERRFCRSSIIKKLLLPILLLLIGTASWAADQPVFPFVLPWDDASPGVTNVSGLLEKPAGGRGFVVARDGHLFEGDKRFRIFGVNFAFGASFPPYADAEKVAARMAKFGINCVRFHHMDNQAAPNGIWSADMVTIDPGQLDKLDYFIAQLKKNGIYADLNLHVSRIYPGMPKWEGMPGFFKGVDNFYPPMVAMQRDYARQLLTHVNPYTGNAYVNEPEVAIIEINNENGLIGEWAGGSLDPMSDVYRVELQGEWNRWLQLKYPSEAALDTAWNAGREPLGAEMLKADDATGAAWSLEQQGASEAFLSRDESGMRISVLRTDGIGWHVQLAQRGIAFLKANHYTISFRARADAPRQMVVVASQAHAPWNQLASINVDLSRDWRDFHFTFQPSADEANGRIVFSNLARAEGSCSLAHLSLRPGGVLGLQEDERLGAMSVFKKSEIGMRTLAAQRDWMTFLYGTELQYWIGMERYIKGILKAQSLIVGTAAGFSPPTIQAQLDVVDGHAYWQHPRFPGKPWDSANWTVNNIPMAGVADGGTLPDLSQHRVAGKPYICTEYNEPAPNTHSSEAFLLLNAYAALQDWDGVFVFAYSHRHDDWDSRRISSFFDLDQHPAKMVTLPAAVSMFLRGDVSSAKTAAPFPVTTDAAINACLRSGPWWGAESFGMQKLLPLQSRVEMDVSEQPASVQSAPPKSGQVTTSDTGEITWDAARGRVTVNTPRNKAFIGRTTGEAVPLGEVTIAAQPNTQNWAAITWTEMNSTGASRHILITATGYAENTGMHWTSAGKDSVGRDWGEAPSRVEGIPAKITLPAQSSIVKAWALDGRGQRMGLVKVSQSPGGVIIEIGPACQTLWYEVEIDGGRLPSAGHFRLDVHLRP